MRLTFSAMFSKPTRRRAAPPHPNLPDDATELLAWFAHWAASRGVPCVTGHGSLWVRLPAGEMRVDVTHLLWPVMSPVDGPPVARDREMVRSPRPADGDAESLARQHCAAAESRARLARRIWGDEDATETDEVLRAALRDEPYS